MPELEVEPIAGYTFLGVFSGPDGRGDMYYDSDGNSAKNFDGITQLYAYFRANTYTLTIGPQEKKVSVTSDSLCRRSAPRLRTAISLTAIITRSPTAVAYSITIRTYSACAIGINRPMPCFRRISSYKTIKSTIWDWTAARTIPTTRLLIISKVLRYS